MYVAVKGGRKAIANAHRLLAKKRRGNPALTEIAPEQINQQLALAVDRVMAEGSLYDRELAALAIKQARGDLIEAIFLVRAYRTTLPRLGYSQSIDTAKMRIERRISATYKDLPGGQVLQDGGHGLRGVAVQATTRGHAGQGAIVVSIIRSPSCADSASPARACGHRPAESPAQAAPCRALPSQRERGQAGR